MSNFSKNLKKLRSIKGVSQQKVAEYLTITKQGYSLYETGNREPDYETLLKLSEYFDVTVDELLNENMEDIDENLVILNRNAKKLSPENRQKLLEMAKLMFKEDFDDWLSRL